MAGVIGKTRRVGRDILEFLEEVAAYFRVTIVVTSGYRSADDQAQAMFKNWKLLQRGKVYSKKALPETHRKKLDDYYKTCYEDQEATATDRADAKSKFIELARTQGPKSKHLAGRAVDIAQSSLSLAAYQVIVTKMRVVREGKRSDIYHFESDCPIPRITATEKKAWGTPVATTGTLSSELALVSMGTGCLGCS